MVATKWSLYPMLILHMYMHVDEVSVKLMNCSWLEESSFKVKFRATPSQKLSEIRS